MHGTPGEQYTVIDENYDVVPQRSALLQNYPNPFNAKTTIEFFLDKEGHVKLSIYDILGREIVTLVDKKMPVGLHTIQYDAETLPSGVYLYTLSTTGRTVSNKMIILN